MDVFYPIDFRKTLNSSATDCGPISETSCSGNPYAAKSFLIFSMAFVEVVDGISITSGQEGCTTDV